MSQENVSDKVRNLQVGLVEMVRSSAEQRSSVCIRNVVLLSLIQQKQIAQGIKFGQRPPSLRKSEGDEGSSDEEEVPRSPLKVLAQVEAEPANTEPKVMNYSFLLILHIRVCCTGVVSSYCMYGKSCMKPFAAPEGEV